MKIAVIGYYGHNNLGDELNLFEMLKLLYRQYPEADITVFSGGLPCLYYKTDYRLILADTMTIGEYRKTLNSFDVVVVGGGGLIFLGANYFNFLLEDIKVPYLFSRMGVDDRIVSQPVCAVLKGILEKACDVTVRTESDRALAREHLGIDCAVVPEAIWNYRAENTSFVHAGKKILVSLNRYSSGFSKTVAECLTAMETPRTVYTVSMQDSSDDFYHNIRSTPQKRVILPEAVSLHQKAAFVAASDLVITSRLHAGLIAMSHGVPAVMLKSTPKVEFLMKELDLERFFCRPGRPTAEMLDEILAQGERLGDELLGKAGGMREKANTDLVPS